jgi:hypothetical protein
MTVVPFTPPPPSLAALENVRREIEQLLLLVSRLHATPNADLVLRNALLCCLAHPLRTLLHFLEAESRTVHYSGGVREENDDILALDFSFQPRRLPISEELRREIDREHDPLSYSSPPGDFHHENRLALIALALPVLRRCADFAAYILKASGLLASPETRSDWQRLCTQLQPFLSAEFTPPPSPSDPT